MQLYGQKGARFRLTKLREERGLTKAHIADVLDIDAGTYSKIESGHRNITFDALVKLGDFYEVSYDYILRGVEPDGVNVWNETGLTAESINLLKAHKGNNLDPIMQSSEFWRLMERILIATDYSDNHMYAERNWDFHVYMAHKRLNELLLELRKQSIEQLNYTEQRSVDKLRCELDRCDESDAANEFDVHDM